jgi:integrase
MAAARKGSRYGHRDATMILIGYRHGLRASELCDLKWSQVELNTGSAARPPGQERLAERASPSGRRNPRLAPPTARTGVVLARLHDGARRANDAEGVPCAVWPDRGSDGDAVRMHPHMLRHGCGFAFGQCRPRHAVIAGLAWASEYSAHGALHRAGTGQVQKLLARLGSRSP